MASLIAIALVLTACNNGNGHQRDNSFSYWSQGESSGASRAEEREARRRMGEALKAAQELSKDPSLPEAERTRLRKAIGNLHKALLDYDALWARGQTNVVIMASLGTAASAIIADDLTIIGVANDWSVVFIAAAAMATHILTESPASNDELVMAWREVGFT